MNLMKYAEQSQHMFDPLNEVDALIVSQLVYFDFENHTLTVPLPIKALSCLDLRKTKGKSMMAKKHYRFLKKLIENEVYHNIEILDFICINETETQQQFAALTCRFAERGLFVAFRGTDSTIVGWKEDLNMSFSKTVLSQWTATDYLNRILNTYPDDSVYAGGHSKGGNLAVFAAAYASASFAERIIKVYNFDGPGFHSSIIESAAYQDILDKSVKYIPQASFIGLLMNSKETTYVISSRQLSVFQHDPYTWRINEDHFIRKPLINPSSVYLNTTLNTWLETISDEQRMRVIDAFYQGFTDLNLIYLRDLRTLATFANFRKLIHMYRDVDPEMKTYVLQLAKQFAAVAIQQMNIKK